MERPRQRAVRRRGARTLLVLGLLTLLAVFLTASVADARTIRGTSAADVLRGTAQADQIYSLAGNDRINVNGGGSDTVSCGSGFDRVVADSRDNVARNCESVRRTDVLLSDLGDEAQHGPTSGHLDPTSSNVEVVGRLKLTNFADDVSDVSATQAPNGRWYAYVGNWGAKCSSGGVNVVDITDPANPVKVRFINSSGSGYVTEGLQALHISTSAYNGDILVVSNEWCRTLPNPKQMPGGISIWDINDPTAPKLLVEAFGDFEVHGNRANESHSAIAWDAGPKAYVAAIDNEELEDVDFFEITDPRNPEMLAETKLPGVNVDAYGSEKTAHDFDVLRFDDDNNPATPERWHLMVSDWDAGWVDVDVQDPENPVIVGETDYATCDQVVETACPPEGNAHQGEWNSDGSVFIGTDEDSSPFRLPIRVTSGALTGQVFPAGEFSFTKQVASFPDGKINGPTVYGGYGCPDDAAEVPNASTLGAGAGEEKIIVFQRGPVGDPNHAAHDACFFSEKIAMGESKGYDVVIVANHHQGAGGGEFPDAFVCGSQGSPVAGTAAGLCVGHRFMHQAFGKAPDYTFPYPSPAPLEPTPGTLGPRIEAASEFDGWGYARLHDASLNEVGQYWLPEQASTDFVSGFGDLTVHEVEVPRGDPDEGGPAPDDDKLAYFAWYSGGFRVLDFTDPAEPVEVGAFIDEGGNDLWGVALAKDASGNRIILASDRDFGLYIFRYTGEIPTP
jgi:hypothetical protein